MCIVLGNSFTIHIYRRKRFAYYWFDRTSNVKPQNRTLWTWAMLRNRYHHESKRIRISQLKNRSTEKQECDNR